jgi:hypothetical protein
MIELHFVPPDLRRLDALAQTELVACGVWEDERPMTGLAGLLDWRLGGRLSHLAREGFLTGALGEALFVPGRPRLPFEKVLVLGCGPRGKFGDDPFRTVLAKLMASLEGLRVRRAVIELPGRAGAAVDPERAAEIVIERVDASPDHDAWWLVEHAEAQQLIAQRAQDERRRARRI